MEDDNDIPDSRVFVSGLPPKFTSNQLGAHFAGRYQITDAVVIPDRRIGFVGFRNYTLAKNAIKYFDKTYIRMSKISVQMAQAVEIERTKTSQGVPKSKSKSNVFQSLPEVKNLESIQRSAPPTGEIKSNRDLDFQPYIPISNSNKRKREAISEQSGESPRPLPTAPSTNAAAALEEQHDDQDLKTASRSKKKSCQEQNTILDSIQKGDEGQPEDSAEEVGNKKRKKKEKNQKTTADVGEPGHRDTALALPQKGDDTLQADQMAGKEKKDQEAKSKSKKKKTKIREATTNGDNGRNQKPQVDDDTKGGVEPIDDVAIELSEQSADQNKQQRRNDDITSDHDWLRSKTNRVLDLVDEVLPNNAPVIPELGQRINGTSVYQEVEQQGQLGAIPEKPSIVPVPDSRHSSGRLFLRNLPYTANESDIEMLFSKYGNLDEVHLVRDKAGNSKGIGYIQYSDKELAKNAVGVLDGKSFQGRLLHILEAAEKNFHKLDEYEISKLPLKKQKAIKRKMEAGGSTFNWNSMYMNPNAVLSSVADRLGVAKADLIDVSSSDAAVKQAHAETHVIQETKAYFASNGVNLDAFKQHERDETTLLIKNFPFGTTAEELKTLFVPYGEISKFLLPPSGTTAIIQFSQPGEGSQAMRNLAYRNFKGSVIYLEKAPKNLLDAKFESISGKLTPEKPTAVAKEVDNTGTGGESSSTLFVRNLNFSTTTAGLIDAFKPLSGFLTARVKTKIDPKRPNELLSMGFGFVEFSNNNDAKAALAVMNGYRLDKHELLVQVSRKASDAAEEQRQKDVTRKAGAHKTKLIIKNLPFETTRKDIRALLSAYGQIRSVKVPQKFDHSIRGFAFADFVTAKEAENAMEALKDTHLLGRRLVMEFADEESIDPEDEIRAIEDKVGRQTEVIQLNKMTGSSRKKFILGVQDEVQ